MEYLIDTCVWIDQTRTSTPNEIRQIANQAINRSGVVICEPIWFELLRLCPKNQRQGIEKRLSTIPMLLTPTDLWRKATLWGQKCRDAGIQTGYSDLLIASICSHHKVGMVTFDRHFEKMAHVIGFEVKFLPRIT